VNAMSGPAGKQLENGHGENGASIELRPFFMMSGSGSSAWKPKSPPLNTGPPGSGFTLLCPIA